VGKRKHFINLMFTLTLLGVFALTALSVAVLGARVYNLSASGMQANADTRTSLVYLAEKVRQSPRWNFEMRKAGDADALVLKDTYENNVIESWIFASDGKLREVVVKAGAPVSSTDGQSIMSLKSLTFEKRGEMLFIAAETVSGRKETLLLSRRVDP
jgi:hypothetical protein